MYVEFDLSLTPKGWQHVALSPAPVPAPPQGGCGDVRVCARKLTGRELPSLGELRAMQRTDLVKYPPARLIQAAG